ncbi:MAG: alpha/beta fold hydrolase [Synechococcales cyanobacterium]
MHYTIAGADLTSTPILLVHGFGASVGHWRRNITALATTHPVYALDLLGFGDSDKPILDYTIDLWVAQVREFWQTHIRRPVILVGHSVGGLVTLDLTARDPDMVQGLCLISCADGPHPEELPAPLGWLVQGLCEGLVNVLSCPLTYPALFDWIRQKDVLRLWIKNVYRRTEAVDDELVSIFQRPAYDTNAQQVFIEALRAVLTRPFTSPRLLLPSIERPILVLWGQDDPAVPSFLADKFKEWQPRLTLVKLPGVGHCAHDELPDWVNTLMREWIASLAAVPPSRKPAVLG